MPDWCRGRGLTGITLEPTDVCRKDVGQEPEHHRHPPQSSTPKPARPPCPFPDLAPAWASGTVTREACSGTAQTARTTLDTAIHPNRPHAPATRHPTQTSSRPCTPTQVAQRWAVECHADGQSIKLRPSSLQWTEPAPTTSLDTAPTPSLDPDAGDASWRSCIDQIGDGYCLDLRDHGAVGDEGCEAVAACLPSKPALRSLILAGMMSGRAGVALPCTLQHTGVGPNGVILGVLHRV